MRFCYLVMPEKFHFLRVQGKTNWTDRWHAHLHIAYTAFALTSHSHSTHNITHTQIKLTHTHAHTHTHTKRFIEHHMQFQKNSEWKDPNNPGGDQCVTKWPETPSQ